nr:MAG TPA: hypothetical protein [Caudoviricetes sp.]
MNELQITEYKNIRVLTTQQIAEAYGSDTRVISNNFNRNKERYIEGKHYICLEDGEKREFVDHHQIDDGSKKASKLYLWTEKGAFLHAKSLNTDVAWEMYDKLVDSYFEKSKAVPMTTDQKIQLLAQGNVELTEKIDKVDKDLQEFKADMPLLALECQRITRAKNQKVVPLMGGKDAPAYKNKSLMHKVYSDVDAQLRREFGVNTYKAIKRSQCDLAVEIIKKYELPRCLREEIEDENSQMCFAV